MLSLSLHCVFKPVSLHAIRTLCVNEKEFFINRVTDRPLKLKAKTNEGSVRLYLYGSFRSHISLHHSVLTGGVDHSVRDWGQPSCVESKRFSGILFILLFIFPCSYCERYESRIVVSSVEFHWKIIHFLTTRHTQNITNQTIVLIIVNFLISNYLYLVRYFRIYAVRSTGKYLIN